MMRGKRERRRESHLQHGGGEGVFMGVPPGNHQWIAGCFGKHCDFESHEKTFERSLNWWKGGSVAGLIVQSVNPFTSSKQPLSLRAEAFDSIGLVCQSWPYQFTQEHISNAFQDVLRKGEPELQIRRRTTPEPSIRSLRAQSPTIRIVRTWDAVTVP
ncbi:hypothetical protein BDR22DRAFT_242085 [Usnea florida]